MTGLQPTTTQTLEYMQGITRRASVAVTGRNIEFTLRGSEYYLPPGQLGRAELKFSMSPNQLTELIEVLKAAQALTDG